MTTYTPPPEPGRTASRRNRPVPLVIGILLALMGLPLLLAGLGLGWAVATQRDDDGFFSTPTEQLTTETVALSSELVKLGNAGPDAHGSRRFSSADWRPDVPRSSDFPDPPCIAACALREAILPTLLASWHRICRFDVGPVLRA